MKRAALYARVSTETQQKEGTIESQVVELKKQIAANGDELVKEYIDDGHSGKYLDRPALEQLRAALKTDAFEAIYFLSADRIARDVLHQNIIIGELLKYKKRIIINGKDYEENPENRFTLTVLGAVSQFERAKILERMRRGTLHRLRTGQLTSHGFRTYGYDYRRKTATQPAALVINEKQAAVVRSMFEMYASGHFTLNAIARSLEKRSVLTVRGKGLWYAGNIKGMLHNSTYAGTRYFNRSTNVSEASGDGKRPTPKRVDRDREDWIAVRVPAIVSRELFDKVQELLRIASERYCLPSVPHLLAGLIRCAECGRSYSSARRYVTNLLPSGTVSVYHRALYRCNRHLNDNGHDASRLTRCRNSTVATHILDNKVVDMIREVLFDPGKLGLCIESSDRVVDPTSARKLARIAREIKHLDDERRHIIERYATERIAAEEYVRRNLALDQAIDRLKREKAEITSALRDAGAENFLDASIRHFCATARARFEECAEFDAKRQFLRGHVERIFFDHGKVTIVGNVGVPSPATNEKELQFRIEGEIDRAIARSKSSRGLWKDERSTSWVPGAAPTYFR
jgi:site-specific DNA recombinase